MLHEPQIMDYEFELVLQIFLRTFMIFDFLKKRVHIPLNQIQI